MSNTVPVALPLGLLAAAACLSAAGTRVMDPLLHVIATDFATTVPAVSVVVAAFTLPYGLCQILLGPLGDRFGKLRVMLVSLLTLAVVSAGCALAGGLSSLTLLRIGAGAASAAIIPVGMAYVADAVDYANRQVTISRFLNGVVLAQILAGPVGGLFGEYFGWRGVFLVLAAGSLLVAIALWRRIDRLPDRRGTAATFSLSNYAALLRPGVGRLVLLAALIDGVVLMGSFPFLAPYMHEAFGLSYASVGLVLACFGLGAFGYIRSAAWLVPRLGEPGMVLAGGTIMAAAVAAAVLTPAWPALIAVQAAMGFGFYLLHGVLQARATEMLPHARATAVATFAFMLFLGQSLGALAMGALIAQLGYRTAFLLDSVAVLALGVWLWRLLGRKRR